LVGPVRDGVGVTFALFDDNFAAHPKVVPLSDGAFRLHASAILYSARHLTDGVVHKTLVRTLIPTYRASYVQELTKAGMWVKTSDGFRIHDYLEWNKSRETILAERERKREAGKRGAQRRWKNDD